jgi:hypothetical protein
MWWPNNYAQPLADRARYDWIGMGNYDADRAAALRAANPNIKLFGSNNARELDWREGDYTHELNVELRSASLAWLLTQVGSTLTTDIDGTTTVIPVAAISRNGSVLFAAGDVFVIDDELFKISSISGLNLTVQRGTYMGTPAKSHAKGTRVADIVTSWPGAIEFDVTSECPLADVGHGPETWNQWNARRLKTDMTTAGWDGMIIDCVEPSVSWVIGNGTGGHQPVRSIDWTRSNGFATDDYRSFDAAWVAGIASYARTVRSLLGPDAIVFANGGCRNLTSFNGAIFEGYPNDDTFAAGWGGWHEEIIGPRLSKNSASYLEWSSALQPSYALIETYESDSWLDPNPFGTPGWHPNYQKMRFGLATALMGNGFFSYEMATNGHGSAGLMWFDEYDNAGAGRGYLGQPTGAALRVGAHEVWRRNFTGGTVLVNAEPTAQTVVLDRTYRKIRGTQAPTVNDGSLVNAVTLRPQDGLVLLTTDTVLATKPILSIPRTPSTMSHSRHCTIYGYLKPRHTAGSYPVRIYKYKLVSGHWKSYGYESAKASNYSSYTKYSHSIKLPYRGRWRLRAYAPADALHLGTWSGYSYVTVR